MNFLQLSKSIHFGPDLCFLAFSTVLWQKDGCTPFGQLLTSFDQGLDVIPSRWYCVKTWNLPLKLYVADREIWDITMLSIPDQASSCESLILTPILYCTYCDSGVVQSCKTSVCIRAHKQHQAARKQPPLRCSESPLRHRQFWDACDGLAMGHGHSSILGNSTLQSHENSPMISRCLS